MNLLDFHGSGRRTLDSALSSLAEIGYKGPLVKRKYPYRDRFAPGQPERRIDAALFGREPVSYETATFGLVLADGLRGTPLINEHRSLGAPLVIEIDDEDLSIWSVGGSEGSTQIREKFGIDGFRNWLGQHQGDLRPTDYLRTKDISGGPAFYQPSLFGGLIPELDDATYRTLDPLLRHVIEKGIAEYKRTTGNSPAESELFKLTFWLMTGKVFADRAHREFKHLTETSGPDEVLRRVAEHYGETPGRLLNRQTRDVIFDNIWNKLDFRHLSVEVLSQIWSRTLVTKETRKRLGIHRTRRSIVRYIIDQIPFGDFDAGDRRVLEPCTGSAAFLIGAMDRMRDFADMHSPRVRNSYFQRILKGVERDPFGVEISRLCLALADYPSPNGWKIYPGDVFDPKALDAPLSEARIILCNPPFEKFEPEEKEEYKATHWFKPAELLWRILKGIRPDAVLGFVLPRTFLDGQDYRDVRSEVVRRFGKIDLVSLPGKMQVWGDVAPETVLLTATEPHIGERATVTRGVVRDQDWQQFAWFHHVRSRDTDTISVEGARDSLVVPELRPIWDYLACRRKLGDFASPSRGIEWNVPLKENKDILVRTEPFPNSRSGIPPLAKFSAFCRPIIKHLNFDKEYRLYDAFDLPWDRPKVFMNKARRSRGMWRVAAFADFDGLACYQTFIALWPENPALTQAIAAVLNGPVANAFLAVHSKESFALDTIRDVPFPLLTASRVAEINRLVDAYQEAIGEFTFPRSIADRAADGLLRQLDAIILDAYGLPPRLERQLLDAFNGGGRIVPFDFADYFPSDFTPCFSLKDWLSGWPAEATVGSFRAKGRNAPDHVIQALKVADGTEDDDDGI